MALSASAGSRCRYSWRRGSSARRAAMVATSGAVARRLEPTSQGLVSKLGPVPAHHAAARLPRLRRIVGRAARRALLVADEEVHDQCVELLALGPVTAGHVA